MTEEFGDVLLEPSDALKSVTILLVEDDEDVRELLIRFLKKRVGALHLAANGREGVEMPIAAQMKAVLYEDKPPREALEALMLRSLKRE